jgi:thioredoxin 1
LADKKTSSTFTAEKITINILDMVQVITDQNYTEVLQEEKLIVLDFWAEWCGPCRMVSPVIDELAGEYDGKVIIGKVDVDDNNEIATAYGIRNIPTILFLKGGKVVDKQVGVTPKKDFVEKIERLLS